MKRAASPTLDIHNSCGDTQLYVCMSTAKRQRTTNAHLVLAYVPRHRRRTREGRTHYAIANWSTTVPASRFKRRCVTKSQTWTHSGDVLWHCFTMHPSPGLRVFSVSVAGWESDSLVAVGRNVTRGYINVSHWQQEWMCPQPGRSDFGSLPRQLFDRETST